MVRYALMGKEVRVALRWRNKFAMWDELNDLFHWQWAQGFAIMGVDMYQTSLPTSCGHIIEAEEQKVYHSGKFELETQFVLEFLENL